MKKLEETIDFEIVNFDYPIVDQSEDIIKVIGVGGGGGNAVSKMYQNRVHNVSFAICNTDSQALNLTEAPVKVQLGPGLGAGGDPEKGRQYALDSMDSIEALFDDRTQMVFVTAGLGGGTGTGAGPVIAKTAREKGILTIGVVTIPFRFEQKRQIQKALNGVMEMKQNVDALLVINNERLREIYEDLSLVNAFEKTDEILMVATKSIAEIITKKGIINRDFRDVCTVMRDGGSAIMSEGRATGEKRVEKAMLNALNSPLINNVDIKKAKKLLYIIYQSNDHPLMTSELNEVTEFMDELQKEVEVLWGLYEDESLGEEVKVNIIATGFDDLPQQSSAHVESENAISAMMDVYYGEQKPAKPSAPEKPAVPEPEPEEADELEDEDAPDEEDEDTEDAPMPKEQKSLGRMWGNLLENLQRLISEE